MFKQAIVPTVPALEFFKLCQADDFAKGTFSRNSELRYARKEIQSGFI